MTVYLEKNDVYSTLTTWIYCNFWQLWAAEQIGLEGYIHWPKGKFVKSYEDNEMYSKVRNAYDWYFVQPKVSDPRVYGSVWTWEHPNWGSGIDVSPYQFMGQPLSVIREFYKRNLIFNEETNRRGQELVSKYGIDFSKTIGITWRGTDIYLESLNGNHGRPRMAIETYFPFIDEILSENPDFRIMCTAEEKQVLDPLLARYPQAFRIEEFLQSPYQGTQNPERSGLGTGYERGLQPVLMVWLFSKCAYYIKNRASTAAVASWISDGKIISLGHPETLGFYEGGKPFKEVAEINGVEQPLYR